MRKSTTLKPSFWLKLKNLPANTKLVYLFLLTGPDTNLSGLVYYPTSEIAKRTGLSEDQCCAAMDELVSGGRIEWCRDDDLILLLKWFKHNPVVGARQISGAQYHIESYSWHPIHSKALALLVEYSQNTLSDRVSYTPKGKGNVFNISEEEKIVQQTAVKQYPDAVHEAAVAVTVYINSKYGKRRKPDNATLLKAISLVIKAGHSPDDVLKVVKYRTTKQDWYDPDKYGIESLIRAGGFASELERATETAEPKTVWLT